MIEVENLTKSFGPLPVLKGLSFRVSCGALVVVLGPSGAGKLTLLRCLNGLVTPFRAARCLLTGSGSTDDTWLLYGSASGSSSRA